MESNGKIYSCKQSEEIGFQGVSYVPLDEFILIGSLWNPTRFTSIGGQDRNQPLPYDPSLPVEDQVRSSVQRSLSNLRTSYLDSLLLHSPFPTLEKTLSAWRVLMSLQDAGTVKMIGVSNTYDVSILKALESEGGRKAQVVQNRWYEGNHWDRDVVTYCKEHGIQYQSVLLHCLYGV